MTTIEKIKNAQRVAYKSYKAGEIDWNECRTIQMEGDAMIEDITGLTEDDYMEEKLYE